jgi:hypothetical protein
MMSGIVAILSIFIALPGIIFTYAYKSKKDKTELKKLQYQKEILELEIRRDNRRIRLLEEENKKLDKIIHNCPPDELKSLL